MEAGLATDAAVVSNCTGTWSDGYDASSSTANTLCSGCPVGLLIDTLHMPMAGCGKPASGAAPWRNSRLVLERTALAVQVESRRHARRPCIRAVPEQRGVRVDPACLLRRPSPTCPSRDHSRVSSSIQRIADAMGLTRSNVSRWVVIRMVYTGSWGAAAVPQLRCPSSCRAASKHWQSSSTAAANRESRRWTAPSSASRSTATRSPLTAST